MFGINSINFNMTNINTLNFKYNQISIGFNNQINDSLNLSGLSNTNPFVTGLIGGLTGGLIGGLLGGLLSNNPMSFGFPQQQNNQNINNQLLLSLLILLVSLILSQNSQGGGIPFGTPFGNQLGSPLGSPLGAPFGGMNPPYFGYPNSPLQNNPLQNNPLQNNPQQNNPADQSIGGGNGNVVNLALQQVGKPYVFGAEGPNAFDCSGLVQWVFKRCGKNLPRTAEEQFRVGTPVQKNQLQPGDLVFFANTYKPGISHVGIYIGNGKFVHAANSREGVKVSSLSESYYVQHYAGAKRV